jgi:isoaspartyl peptidase/L-asparaginase-like protein (Ntn-hydrolase superfamily)
LKGRVGDAPFIVNNIGGATVTGFGESIMKVTLARDVVYNMENGQNAQVRFLNLQYYNATIKQFNWRLYTILSAFNYIY